MRSVLDKLEQLGFSPYEAKAYYTLLRKHPANGYEISKIGKIPAAKIYETLHRLKLKEVIVESGTESGKYYPVPPGTLMGKVKNDFTQLINSLETQLIETAPITELDLTMNITGYEVLVDKMREVIQNATSSVFLSLWPEEALLLADTVAAATTRGLTVKAATFGKVTLKCTYFINLETCGASSRSRLGKRLNAVVCDNRDVVLGEIDTNSEAEGVWTTTPAIVLVTKEYIKHDIWGNVLINALGPGRFQELCDEQPLLNYLVKNR